MNKKLWLGVAVGALVGAAAVQTVHVISDRNSRELFGQRLRCKTLADKYVKDRSRVVLSRIEFSHSRSSCIASTYEQLGLDAATGEQLGLKPTGKSYMFSVVDLLTDEGLMSRTCTTTKDFDWAQPECSKGLQERDKAFEDAR